MYEATSDTRPFHVPKSKPRSPTKSASRSSRPLWEPTCAEVNAMWDAFSALTLTRWEVLGHKTENAPRWSNKCLQRCVLNMCVGRLRKHATRVFNRRCCNDVASGYGSVLASENMLAVTDCLHVHHLFVSILEEKEDGRCEEFILGSGEQCFGFFCLDAQSGHASMVPRDVSVERFSTEVSSQPWLRSAVGADFLSHDLPANMRLFKPSNVSPNIEPNGYILVDSFHYKKIKRISKRHSTFPTFWKKYTSALAMLFTRYVQEEQLALIAATAPHFILKCSIAFRATKTS